MEMTQLDNKIFNTKYQIMKHILTDGICQNWHNLHGVGVSVAQNHWTWKIYCRLENLT